MPTNIGDQFDFKVTASPKVELGVDADGDNVQVLHHDVKRELGGFILVNGKQVDPAGNYRWMQTVNEGCSYLVSKIVLDELNYTDLVTKSNSDLVIGVYIKHLGTDLGNQSTTDQIYISQTGGDRDSKCLKLDANESIVLKFGSETSQITIADLVCQASGSSPTGVRYYALGFCKDVSP